MGSFGTKFTESCGLAGEAEEEGYEDEYQLEDIDIGAANYIKATPLGNWRHMWEDTSPDSEVADDYGLGVREGLQVPQPSSLMMRRACAISLLTVPSPCCMIQTSKSTAPFTAHHRGQHQDKLLSWETGSLYRCGDRACVTVVCRLSRGKFCQDAECEQWRVRRMLWMLWSPFWACAPATAQTLCRPMRAHTQCCCQVTSEQPMGLRLLQCMTEWLGRQCLSVHASGPMKVVQGFLSHTLRVNLSR